jgi:hypothetical protein
MAQKWNWAWWMGLLLPLVLHGQPLDPPRQPESFRVPYQLTDTKHILVRVKINGKGPFNLIVDTGAPAIFLATEAANKAGIRPDAQGWGNFERFDVEGGIKLRNVTARIETPFQVEGMNKMNLPGIRYDGMMGYTLLAQFRIELDLNQPHMTWTKLAWNPPAPVGLRGGGDASGLGALVQFAALLIGKRPDPVVVLRGFQGYEARENERQIVITKVLQGSPADLAGIKSGDVISTIGGAQIGSLIELHKRSAELEAGSEVRLGLVRDGQPVSATIKPTKGL